jgi:hypothetical protein
MFTATAFSSQDIVRDSLVLWLDANDKTSYPGTGTVWRDLSLGSNTGTLTNGPTFSSANGGSIVFDGVNDYVNQNINSGLFTTEATLTIFLKLSLSTPVNSSQTGIERLSFNTGKQASHYPWVDGLAYLGTFQTGTTRINSISLSNTIARNNWHSITITSSPGTDNWKFYQNNDLIKTALGSNTILLSSDSIYNIGRSQATSGTLYSMNGTIGQILLYNRALSPTEILQNYNATKTRYGL